MGINIEFLLVWLLPCVILTIIFFKCIWADFKEDGMDLRDLLTTLFFIFTPGLNIAIVIILLLVLAIEKTERVVLKMEDAVSRILDKKVIKPKKRLD